LRVFARTNTESHTHRHWIHDDHFDLFVWQTDTGDVTLFQLCYGIAPDERALVWRRESGLFYDGTETGDTFVVGEIVQRLDTVAEALPREVRNTVSRRIREYLEGKLPAAARRKHFRGEVRQETPPR
jgi:hypothetical protein